MKIIEDKTLLPPRKRYEDVDPKFTNFTDRCRVLPVNYYNEYNTVFTLKARYEPGENKYFPNSLFFIFEKKFICSTRIKMILTFNI
jgi:hypothetical protein